MLGPFTFTFTFESEEFEKFEKVGAAAAADLYQTMITTRAPDGANNTRKRNVLFFAVNHPLPIIAAVGLVSKMDFVHKFDKNVLRKF